MTAAPYTALLERGILLERINDTTPSRYVEFDRGDHDAFRAAHSNPQKGFHARLVNQSGGIVINRWDVDGDRLPSYVRFDQKVQPDTRRKRRTKYIYPGKESIHRFGLQPAKRWDVHPGVREALPMADTVYLCIEGCLRADALWSRGHAAISVPSVTMWRAPDEHIGKLLPLLEGKKIFVVADSDFHVLGYRRQDGQPIFAARDQLGTDDVRTFVRWQTDRCVAWLVELGLDPMFCIPPWIHPTEARRRGISPRDRVKIGIDDHLAWGKNLNRWDKNRNPNGVKIFRHRATLVLPKIPGVRRDWHERVQAFYTWLQATHGREGLYSPADAAKELNMHPKQVQRAKDDLVNRYQALRIWHGNVVAEVSSGTFRNRPHLFRFQAR